MEKENRNIYIPIYEPNEPKGKRNIVANVALIQ